MFGTLMFFIYRLLCLLMLSSPLHAMELLLDERIPVSQQSASAAQSLKNTAAPADGSFLPREIKRASLTEKHMPIDLPHVKQDEYTKSSVFHLWWLLLLPAVLLALCLGWFIGHFKNQQENRPKKLVMRQAAQKNNHALIAKSIKKKNDRSQLKRRQSVRRKSLQAEVVFDFSELNKAYNCHRFGRHQDMMEIMHRAFKYDPFDLNIYILSLTILAESDEPSIELTRLLRTGLFLLRTKRPFVWEDVAEKGRDLMPDLEDWSWTPK
ncbi:MAG: hypothetical protein Q9M20_01680 [Mariprofundaceae bacterium]|nr:hypothetical protein [Mariprofundaceae bacterium]